MRLGFNGLKRVAIGQILPHIRENREIRLEDIPAIMDLLEADFVDPARVSGATQKIWGIYQTNPAFSLNYREFKVLAAGLD